MGYSVGRSHISEAQWDHFWEQGYVRIGKVATDEEVAELRAEIDKVAIGRGSDPLAFRKIEELYSNPVFVSYMQKPIFREACGEVYGGRTSISCYRAMVMNKPSTGGYRLEWHQDHWGEIIPNPLLVTHTALDQATIENGCLWIAPKSHDIEGGDDAEHYEQWKKDVLAGIEPVAIEMEPGDAILMHNYTLHSSGENKTNKQRRIFNACYMPSRTKSRDGREFVKMF